MNLKLMNKLVKKLASCDLSASAFIIIKKQQSRGESVYKKELAEALDLFTKLPCPETAANLVYVCPEFSKVIAIANDKFVRIFPKEERGPFYEGYDEYMNFINKNLNITEKIQSFLNKECAFGLITISFHQMRDQEIVFKRLQRIGKKKGLFEDGYKFLRNIITKQLSAFRAVADLICIHGIYDGRERFWNAVGSECNSQLYTKSEVLYNVSAIADKFLDLIRFFESAELLNGTDIL